MGIFSFLSKESGHTTAIIDIGSSSVGAALVNYPTGKNTNLCPVITYSTRKEIIFDDSLDFKRFITALSNALETTIEDLHKHTKGPIKHYNCSLPSPLYLSHTKNINYSEEEAFVVTKDLFEELTGAGADQFRTTHNQLYPELIQDRTYVLESNVMQAKLNGYEAPHPLKKEAKSLTIAHHVSLSSNAIKQKFTDSITKYDQRATIRFHSYAFELFSTLRDVLAERNFLIIDMSGELTDAMMIVNDVLLETASFPLGRNFLLRSIANTLSSNYSEAGSILNMYTAGKTNPSTTEKINEALTSVREEWLTHFRNTLTSFQESGLLPEHVFLIGSDSSSQLAKKWINEEQSLIDFTLSHRTFNAQILSPEVLKGFCDGLPEHQTDMALLLESLFYAKIEKSTRS